MSVTDVETTIRRVSASDPIEGAVQALQQDGVVIVENLLDADLLARFNAELDPLLEARTPQRDFLNPALAYFFGDKTRHITGVAGKSPIFATEVMTHPSLMAICDAVLLPNCASYQLNLGHVLDRGPGAGAQVLHRDELVWVHLPNPHPTVQVASMIALVDFTAENGATLVVPGSHSGSGHTLSAENEGNAKAIPAEMKAGSAVIYLGSTLHSAGSNTTDSWRRGMHVSYVAGWLRTEENHYLTTWPDVARTLPPESLRLLGYGAHDAIEDSGGYLGAVDLRDPVELIANGQL